MEKYSVQVEDEEKAQDKVKVGTRTPACPKCGATLDSPHHCPVHGTEPFEKKSQQGT